MEQVLRDRLCVFAFFGIGTRFGAKAKPEHKKLHRKLELYT